MPSDTKKYQHIFFFLIQEDDYTVDPLLLNLYKVEDESTKGTKASGATLKDAEFVCKFYFDDAYNNAKEAKNDTPDATWTFSTRNVESYLNNAGSDSDTNFAYYAENFGIPANEGSKIKLAGIDFSPKNRYDDREKWKNPFLTSDNVDSYRKFWGQEGTYVIYEKTAPEGFKIAGTMTCGANPKKMTTTNLKEGIAIYYAPGPADDYGIYYVNGELVKENVKGLNEDPDSEPEVVMAVADVQKVPKIETNAYVMERSGDIFAGDLLSRTKTQFVKADGSTITDTPASATDGPSKSCKLSSDDPLFSDGVCTITVDGKISTAGLANHTLVFINKLEFKIYRAACKRCSRK